jgi:hypothetical protein
MARLLAPIQKRAAQINTGTFRTTAASVVEIEAYLLPIGQQMQKTSLQTTFRILSTPLYTTISAQRNTESKTNRSLLEHHKITLKRQYKIKHTHLERRYPHITETMVGTTGSYHR